MIAPTGPLAAHGATAALAMVEPAAPAASVPAADRVPLADALRACLAQLEDRPECFGAAAAWHARWCVQAPALTLAEAVSALGALQALAGPGALPADRALQALSERHGLDEVAAVLAAWAPRRRRVGRGRVSAGGEWGAA